MVEKEDWREISIASNDTRWKEEVRRDIKQFARRGGDMGIWVVCAWDNGDGIVLYVKWIGHAGTPWTAESQDEIKQIRNSRIPHHPFLYFPLFCFILFLFLFFFVFLSSSFSLQTKPQGEVGGGGEETESGDRRKGK